MCFPTTKRGLSDGAEVPLLSRAQRSPEEEEEKSYGATVNPDYANQRLWQVYEKGEAFDPLNTKSYCDKIFKLYKEGASPGRVLWALAINGDDKLETIRRILQDLTNKNADIQKIINRVESDGKKDGRSFGSSFNAAANNHQLKTVNLLLDYGDLFTKEGLDENAFNGVLRGLVISDQDTIGWGASREFLKKYRIDEVIKYKKFPQLVDREEIWQAWLMSNLTEFCKVLEKVTPDDFNTTGEWEYVPFYWPHFQRKRDLEILLYQKYTSVESTNFLVLLCLAFQKAKTQKQQNLLDFLQREKGIQQLGKFSEIDSAILHNESEEDVIDNIKKAPPFSLIQKGPLPSINTLVLARELEKNAVVNCIIEKLQEKGCNELHLSLFFHEPDPVICRKIDNASKQELEKQVPLVGGFTPQTLAEFYERGQVVEAIRKRLTLLNSQDQGIGLFHQNF